MVGGVISFGSSNFITCDSGSSEPENAAIKAVMSDVVDVVGEGWLFTGYLMKSMNGLVDN